jgi:hypothetical protein
MLDTPKPEYALKRSMPEGSVFQKIFYCTFEKAGEPLYFAVLNKWLWLICVPVFVASPSCASASVSPRRCLPALYLQRNFQLPLTPLPGESIYNGA